MNQIEAIKDGFEVRVKIGWIDDDFIQDRFTLRVTVHKDNHRGVATYRMEDSLLDNELVMNEAIRRLSYLAVKDYYIRLEEGENPYR